MKVIIIKEIPNIHLIRFIKKIKNTHDGIVSIINALTKTKKLLSNDFIDNWNTKLFKDLQFKLNNKKSNEIVFLYINNDDQIKELQNKYQTITVDEDFIFDIIEYKEDRIKIQNLINKLI